MVANEQMYDRNGTQVLLFPLEYMYLSTARNPDEHQELAMDFLGWGANGRVYDCPCYAPCDLEVVYTGNDHNMICWSKNPVLLANGQIDNVSILVAHSMTAPGSVGTNYSQGQLWYHTGNYGHSTGDHLHLEIARGHVKWNSSGTALQNPSHLYDCMYVNDTHLIRPQSYEWLEFKRPTPPPHSMSNYMNIMNILYIHKRREVE